MGNGLHKSVEKGDWKCVRSMLWDVHVQRRVRSKTYFIQTKERPGDPPIWDEVRFLHVLLHKRVPLDVLLKVLEVGGRDHLVHPSRTSRELPLHYALRGIPQRLAVLTRLLDECPEPVLLFRNVSGKTPLHVACEALQPVAAIRELVARGPDAVRVRDGDGDTPWGVLQRGGGLRRRLHRWRLRSLLDPEPAPKQHDSPTTAEEEEEEEDNLCVLCWNAPADTALVPCGHICLCVCCAATSMASLGHRCPVCKTGLDEDRPSLRVFRAGIARTR